MSRTPMSLKFAVFVTLTTLSALGLSQNQAQASEPVAPDEPTLTSLGGGSSASEQGKPEVGGGGSTLQQAPAAKCIRQMPPYRPGPANHC
jgi:hypothetical protein